MEREEPDLKAGRRKRKEEEEVEEEEEAERQEEMIGHELLA